MTEKLFESVANVVEQRTHRRGFLARVTLTGAALAVAPIRFLTRPQYAWAEEGFCSGDFSCGTGCPNGHCGADGYSTFCCTINGGVNRCPDNSFPAGWWKCSSYTGSRLCDAQNYRFYVDCNLKPGGGWTCTPGCANGTCSNRKTCCECFKYGNCNENNYGGSGNPTVVVCRVVLCGNPGSSGPYADQCSTSGSTNNATCGHEASCL